MKAGKGLFERSGETRAWLGAVAVVGRVRFQMFSEGRAATEYSPWVWGVRGRQSHGCPPSAGWFCSLHGGENWECVGGKPESGWTCCVSGGDSARVVHSSLTFRREARHQTDLEHQCTVGLDELARGQKSVYMQGPGAEEEGWSRLRRSQVAVSWRQVGGRFQRGGLTSSLRAAAAPWNPHRKAQGCLPGRQFTAMGSESPGRRLFLGTVLVRRDI